MRKEDMPAKWREHDASIRPYQRAHRINTIVSTIISWAAMAYLLFSPAGRELEWMLNGRVSSLYTHWLLYFAVLGVILTLIGFPTSFAGWRIERHFGLSKQKFGSWLADLGKGLVLGAVIGFIVLSALHFIVTRAGDSWWIIAGIFFFAFSVLLAQLAPLIIPIFFKLKPMAASPLKEKLLNLCTSQGVTVEEVFHLGLGEKTEKGNAAFVGLGKTKKILIGDTLYEKYPEEQIEAVFAHELGHQVHNDIWKNILLSGALTFLVFFVANQICQAWAFPYFGTSLERPFGMFVFFVVFGLCQWPTGLLMTAFSRARERAADRFADQLQRSKPLAQALEQLTIQNKGLFRPHPIVEFFKYSHPAPWRRIYPRLHPNA